MASSSRNKRQSHPAATVARFPTEFQSGEFNAQQTDQVLPELIDYLTPPKPPEVTNDNPETDFGSGPPPLLPTITSSSSSVSQERQNPDDVNDAKWDLGYNPSDILNPPTDPFSIGAENRYGTINKDGNINQGNNEISQSRPDGFDVNSQFVNDNSGSIDQIKPVTSNERLNFNFDSTSFNIDQSENKFRPIISLNNQQQTNIPLVTNSAANGFFSKRQANLLPGGETPARPVNYQNKRYTEDYDEDSGGERYSDENSNGNYEADSKKKQTGPVYTFVKTDKHGHYKWGVRHGQLNK